jgi:hypothetical protein
MNKTLRKVIAILAAAFILSVAYYGDYLPLRKSQVFISALRELRNIKSLTDFEHTLSVPLDLPSPIGQEELVRNTANIVLNLTQQNDKPETVAEITSFIENYYRPIVERGKGMSFEQNLYIMGAINETAFVRTRDVKYLQAAHNYYNEGLKLGPKRPQFLYGMFDVYRMEGNVEAATTIANQILTQWPDDEQIRNGLNLFLSQVKVVTVTTTPQKKQ